MSDSALEYVKKLTSKMNINLDLVLNIAELGASVLSAYSIIVASIFGKSSILLLSIVFISTFFISYLAFKGCNSEILKDGIGLFLISLINASGLVSIMWIISNTWGNFRYDKIYLTALVLSPIIIALANIIYLYKCMFLLIRLKK